MIRLLLTLCSILLLLPITALAEIKTITHTVQQPFGGSQSPDDARTAGIARAKREALERFGSYIESTTIVKNSQVDSDEILALTAGVTKAEVIKQKNYTEGDAFGLEITVKMELDTDVLDKSLKRLLQDRNHLKDLTAARQREKVLLARIAELEKENKKKGKTATQSAKLKKEFQKTRDGLTAVEWFDKAMALSVDGKVLSDPSKAVEYLSQAIRLAPNNASAYYNRGHGYFYLKQYQQAIKDFSHAIRLDPAYADAYNNRGNGYADLKQYQRAINDYDQAIRLDPNHAIAYNNRGIRYTDLKQYQRAIKDYDQAIKLDPNYAQAYHNRGNAYVYLQQYQRAINEYDQAIRLDPNYALAYYNRGFACVNLQQYQRAINDFSQAIKLDPSYTNAYTNRGRAYSDLKHYRQAINDYDQAISLDPNLVMAYTNRGLAYYNLKHYRQAIYDYDEAIKLDPGLAEAYEMRGLSYYLTKNSTLGCRDLMTACTLGKCGGYEIAQQAGLCK